uniref:Tc1-like transposase DDE domain-containing protein n=1 Tax=Oryzias sinensis TaxID=183150 RepID=A0A8C7WU98_9TELE
MDIRPWKSVLWSDESKLEIFGSNHCVCAIQKRRTDGLYMPGSHHEAWRRRCDGVRVLCWLGSVGDEFQTEGILNQHGYHSILQRHAIPSGLRLVGPSFIFQQDNDPKHTSRLCKDYLTKKESDGVLHQTTWPPQSPDLNPIQMVWNELDRRVKAKGPTSAKHLWELLQDCWKTISGHYLLKLIKRMSRAVVVVLALPINGNIKKMEEHKKLEKYQGLKRRTEKHWRSSYNRSLERPQTSQSR